MRVRGREREGLVAIGGAESTAFVSLEVEDLRRQQAPLLERGRNFLRHGAEVFADDQRLVPNAFQREDAEQVGRWILDEGALFARLSFGNPEQAKESHHVVDAQRA